MYRSVCFLHYTYKRKINKNISQVVTGSTTSLLSFLEFLQGRRVMYINRKGLWHDALSTRRLVYQKTCSLPIQSSTHPHLYQDCILRCSTYFFSYKMSRPSCFLSPSWSPYSHPYACVAWQPETSTCAPMIVPSRFFSVSTST